MNPCVILNQFMLLELIVMYYISDRLTVIFIMMMRACTRIINEILQAQILTRVKVWYAL